MSYILKINSRSTATKGPTKGAHHKLIVSQDIYDALRSNKVLGAVEAISPVGEVSIKTVLGNMLVSNASFLKVLDNVELCIKNDTLIIDQIKSPAQSVKESLVKQDTPKDGSFDSFKLLLKIHDIKEGFDLDKCTIYDVDSQDSLNSIFDAFKDAILEQNTANENIKDVFTLSKNLKWSIIFLPLKFNDYKVLARLFTRNFDSNKYQNIILECEHNSFGNCVVQINIEKSTFSSVDISITTERKMPDDLELMIKNAANNIAFSLGCIYKLHFDMNEKKAQHSIMSEILSEYCINRANSTDIEA